LVNKYVKTDRLGLHVEDTNSFGDVIVGVSLGSPDFLRIVDVSDRKKEFLIELRDRSCYVLAGDARFLYKHGIGRSIANVKYKTKDFERISLTLRHVIDTRRKLG
jgi:alkylated DNA repair dioxygenase AlkB